MAFNHLERIKEEKILIGHIFMGTMKVLKMEFAAKYLFFRCRLILSLSLHSTHATKEII